MSRIRVLLLIKGLGRGGAEQLLVNAAPYVDRERFDYRIAYVLPWKDALVSELERQGLPVACLARPGATRVGPSWAFALRRLVRDGGIDLVHAHLPSAGIGARVALAGLGVPIVYTEHNLWDSYRRASFWMNAITFPRNDHVIAVSDHVRDSIRYPRLAAWLPYPRVEVLYHGIDLSTAVLDDGLAVRRELGIPIDAPVIGMVANLKAKKGHTYLIDALARVRSRHPDVRLVLVGTGPEEDRIRDLVRSLGLGTSVVFAGFREDALRVVSSFDVFVLSSLWEGLSIAMVEAMSIGKPVVATSVGGVPEVIEHRRHGLLVPPEDPAALADALDVLLADADLRRSIGAAGQARSSAFDIRTAVRRSEEIYGEAVAR